MVLFEAVSDDRPVKQGMTGAGVRDMIEEEEDVGRPVDSTPVPSPGAGSTHPPPRVEHGWFDRSQL